MIYELNHAGVRIRDLDASLAFYEGILGAHVVDRAYIPSNRTDCVHVQIAGGLVELLRPADPPGGTRFGLDHIAFMSDDLDGDHRRLAELGFSFSVTPKVAGTGRGRLAFLGDPNGVKVELIQREEIFRVPEITTGLARALDHLGVRADQLADAQTFYRDHMAMTPVTTLHADSPDTTVSYMRLGDDRLGLVKEAMPPAGARPIIHIALRVENVDEATAHLRANGVQVEPGYPRAAGNGSGRLSAVRDPDGVLVELLDRGELHEAAATG